MVETTLPGAPIAGPVLLVTRPRPAAERFLAAARDRLGPALRAVVSPLLEIRPREVAPDLTSVRGAILTSENGLLVQGLAEARLPVWCVGKHTGAAASKAGLDVRAMRPDAESLLAALRAEGPPVPLLHLRGAHARGDLAGRLTKAGIATRDVVVYDQCPVPLTLEARQLLAASTPVLLPLFSPRSAGLAAAGAAEVSAPHCYIAAISPATAAAWHGPPPAVLRVAETPDVPAVLDVVAGFAKAFGPAGQPRPR